MFASRRVSLMFTLVLCCSRFCIAQNPSPQVTVSGHVYYANGSPVEGALVDFKCFCGVGGLLPLPTHTNKDGSFTLPYDALGAGWLTASKESEGFQTLPMLSTVRLAQATHVSI